MEMQFNPEFRILALDFGFWIADFGLKTGDGRTTARAKSKI
jgi:hypothetical protein